MKTVFFRTPKKLVLLGGLCAILFIFYFLQSFHTPERIQPPLSVIDGPKPLPHFPRIEIPLEVANAHRGPHQPAAIQKHFEKIGQEPPAAVPGVLPENAQVVQNALDAIHNAAAEEEEQQAANLVPPRQPNAPAEEKKEPPEEAIDDGGIPFHLTPRRPPEKSTSFSTGPGTVIFVSMTALTILVRESSFPLLLLPNLHDFKAKTTNVSFQNFAVFVLVYQPGGYMASGNKLTLFIALLRLFEGDYILRGNQ